jgi:hypothetical protein
MNLAQGDEVPQIFTLITRQQPAEILTSSAKRVLQHIHPIDGVIDQPSLWIAEDLVLRFRLMVKRGPW